MEMSTLDQLGDNMVGMLTLQAKKITEQTAAIQALKDALHEIGSMAHDGSTGPAVPDLLWDIRCLAYEALR
jgi:hypothetical protein